MMTRDQWQAADQAFMNSVQHKEIRNLYLDALGGDKHAQKKLRRITNSPDAPVHTAAREYEADRASGLLMLHAAIQT
jgi:hypothetical protein